MTTAIVSLVVEQLASFLASFIGEKAEKLWAVEEEVEKLRSEFKAIQGVLEDAERRQVKEAAVKQWLDKLKDVSYDMEDVLDEWNTAILKKQIEGDENPPTKKSKVSSFNPFNVSNPFCKQVGLHHGISIKINELKERLDDIAREKDRLGFILGSGFEEPERCITASVIDVSEVRGRDQDKSRIIDKLLSESSQGPTSRTISIVGMGGIGKTTLAKLVYNDDVVNTHFQKRIWVCVSDPFDELRIAKEILEALTKDDLNAHALESLLQLIRQYIKGNKFLLVLDDMWNEDFSKWEHLKNSLKTGSLGSRILVTTRKENVATIMGTTQSDMLTLKTLSKEDCWSLFNQVAFFDRTREEREKLEDIGGKIVDKCKGLPLAAKTLGSLLRFKKTRDQWLNVYNSEVWELKEAEKSLFSILLLSYSELCSERRRCFSYCAIFPKDYRLDRDELIKLWMAQGYLMATGNEEMEMIGIECFENLAMRSFFQDFVRDENGSIIRCKMHDIVHDFAQFLTKNECLVMEVSNPEEQRIESSNEKARHLMMMLSRNASIPISVCNVKTLRSLIVENNTIRQMNRAAPSEIFNQLKCLRTLNLVQSIIELPKEVGKLIHLRYLNLANNSSLKELPEIVCDLCNLQTLNVSNCRLEKLPYELGKLINLRHLEIYGTKVRFMPKGVERLTSLRTLDVFHVSANDSEASNIGDLKDFNHLRGSLWIKNLRNVNVDEVKKAQLEKKQHLSSLILQFGNFNLSEDEAERRMIDQQIIEVIQPPPNLEQLSIIGNKGTSLFPNWMMSLTVLKKVQICWCDNCELLSGLGKLPSLESLSIGQVKWNLGCRAGMGGMKRVGIEFLGIESEVNKNEGTSKKDEANTSSSPMTVFPKLEQLFFGFMGNWEEWDYGMLRSPITIMPRLRSLQVAECPKLKALPDHVLHSTSLKELKIYRSPIIEERYYKKWKGEDWP